MKGVIHQAYFAPWLGYFSKLALADMFIILDNVKFRKRHYIDRTKIVNMHGNISWVGFQVGENYNKLCNQIYIKNKKDIQVMKETIRHSYRRAKYFEDLWPDIERIFDNSIANSLNLVDVNYRIIIDIMSLLALNIPEIYKSSDYNLPDDATNRIVELCKYTGINDLILGKGKSLEIHNINTLSESGIQLYVQDFHAYHPKYRQLRRSRLPFEKGLSILDMLFNEGKTNTHNAIISKDLNLEKINVNNWFREVN